MELILTIGVVIILAWISSMFFISLISVAIYPWDDRNYTHPKWHTLFPYIFKIQYKEKQKNGQNLVYTTKPDLLGFPFLSNSKYSIKREIFTKEYVESEEYNQLKNKVYKIIEESREKD